MSTKKPPAANLSPRSVLCCIHLSL